MTTNSSVRYYEREEKFPQLTKVEFLTKVWGKNLDLGREEVVTVACCSNIKCSSLKMGVAKTPCGLKSSEKDGEKLLEIFLRDAKS